MPPSEAPFLTPRSYLISRSLLFAIPLVIVFLRLWTEETFGRFTLEQLVFHLSFGTKGLLTGDATLAVDFVREVILLPLAYSLSAVAIIMILGRLPTHGDNNGWRSTFRTAIPIILMAFMMAGVARYLYRTAAVNAKPPTPGQLPASLDYIVLEPGYFTLKVALGLAAAAVIARLTSLPANTGGLLSVALSVRTWLIALLAAIFYAVNYFPASSYAELFTNETAATYIDRHYVAPVYQAPSEPRSLVLIYVESLEASYRQIEDGRALAPLEEATRSWPTLTHYAQVFGTGWTTAGVVSTQCGLPLRPPVGSFLERVNDDVSTRSAILVRATCLGDVLARAGYSNVFLTGSSLSFGGMGEFIGAHGYDKALGREDWISSGETEISEWGLTDDRLFANARQELDRLTAAGHPFNLTILTIDNHGPNGIINDACRADGVSDFLDIVACNAALVANFITYVRQRAPDATIVVTGDHLVHENPYLQALQALPQRHVYGKILPSDGRGVWRTEVSHFDFFPSILESLGFTSPSRRAGLGASFVDPPIADFTNPLSTPGYDEALSARSKLYTEMWKPQLTSRRTAR